MIMHQHEAPLMKSGSMPIPYFIWIRNSNKNIIFPLTTLGIRRCIWKTRHSLKPGWPG